LRQDICGLMQRCNLSRKNKFAENEAYKSLVGEMEVQAMRWPTHARGCGSEFVCCPADAKSAMFANAVGDQRYPSALYKCRMHKTRRMWINATKRNWWSDDNAHTQNRKM